MRESVAPNDDATLTQEIWVLDAGMRPRTREVFAMDPKLFVLHRSSPRRFLVRLRFGSRGIHVSAIVLASSALRWLRPLVHRHNEVAKRVELVQTLMKYELCQACIAASNKLGDGLYCLR
jgi:hypothetical protein